jgi:broad specificity phosphatase PhoE
LKVLFGKTHRQIKEPLGQSTGTLRIYLARHGGESLNQFYERVRATILDFRLQHRSGAILIVGHGVTNQMILRALLGLTLEQATSIRQANDELYLIELDAGNAPLLWKMVSEENLRDL